MRYLMNFVRDFRRVAAAADLKLEVVSAVRHYSSYLPFCPLLFRPDMSFERTVAFLGIRSLHACFLVTLRKLDGAAAPLPLESAGKERAPRP